MKNYLGKIFYLIGDDVKKLPWMLVLFLTLSLLEVIGLSLIIPYISLIINPEALSNSYYLRSELLEISITKARKTILSTVWFEFDPDILYKNYAFDYYQS